MKPTHRIFGRLWRSQKASSLEPTPTNVGDLETVGSSQTSSSFSRLPIEIFLIITNMLDVEWKVLLSLTCKQIRSIVCANFDLSMRDKAVKIRFLQHLDLDLPDYLTCRKCVSMYKWRHLRNVSYRCIRRVAHRGANEPEPKGIFLSTKVELPLTLLPELVDLISRAQQRGPQYGLPPSFLDGDGVGISSGGLHLIVKARWIQNQLVLSVRRETEAVPSRIMLNTTFHMNVWICVHDWSVSSRRDWQTWERKISDAANTGLPTTLKCPYCLTDAEIHVVDAPAGSKKIVLNTWQNFGSRTVRPPGADQSFIADLAHLVRLDERSVRGRDIRAFFESGSSGSPG